TKTSDQTNSAERLTIGATTPSRISSTVARRWPPGASFRFRRRQPSQSRDRISATPKAATPVITQKSNTILCCCGLAASSALCRQQPASRGVAKISGRDRRRRTTPLVSGAFADKQKSDALSHAGRDRRRKQVLVYTLRTGVPGRAGLR